jgi:competence protein ComEC
MDHSIVLVPRLPAVKLFFFLLLGVAASEVLSVPYAHGIALAAGCAALVLPLALLRGTRPLLALLRLALCAPLLLSTGYLLGAVSREQVDTRLLPYADTPEPVLLTGVIDAHPQERPGRCVFVLRALHIASYGRKIPLDDRVQTTCYERSSDGTQRRAGFREGDTLRVSGKLASARPARNVGGFDARSYLRREGISTTLSTSIDKVSIRGRDTSFHLLATPVALLRSSIHETLLALFPAEHAAMLDGLLLGDRGMIDDDVTASLRDAGVIHILAVAGLHVGIMLTLILVPMGRVPLRYRLPAALVLLWLYATLTGMAPPVVRASIMATIVLLGRGLQRAPDTVNSLAVAGVVILLVAPQDLFTAGFQMSFAAVGSIVLFNSRVERALLRLLPKRWRVATARHAAGLLALTLTAQAGTLPLLALYFGQVSLIAFAANLLVVPLVFVVVACAVLALLLAPLSGALAGLYAATSSAALEVILRSSEAFASLPGSVVDVPALPWWAIASWFVGLLLLLGWRRRLLVRLAMTALFACAVWLLLPPLFAGPAEAPCLRITALDVGQGDAILIETPSGRRMLIDAGPSSGGFDAGEKIVVPYLRARGIRTLDAVVFTHPDDDHIGGAVSLLRAIDVRRVIFSQTWKPGPIATPADSALRAEGAVLTDARMGDTIALDPSMRLYVLSSGTSMPEGTEANNCSVVLLLRYGATSILLPGDAETEVEELVAARFGDFVRCDLLKSGHHGSRTSSSATLLDAARPGQALISCGRNNRFGHPKRDILARYAAYGIAVHRTDIGGAVTVLSDGREVRIEETRW